MRIKTLFQILIYLSIVFSSGEIVGKSNNKLKFKSEPERYTVFNAGEDNVNTYRIPSIVVANDSSIIIFSEARRISWQDKSRTDIVVKRSTDSGKTWSPMVDITKGSDGAYMDPTPVIDKNTGEIFLFCTFWPDNDHSGNNNHPVLIQSKDNGITWSEPQDATELILKPGQVSMGFGPGNGIQMTGDKYKGRLIVPMRAKNSETNKGYDLALYSDDHGKSWHQGEGSPGDREFQIAEAKNDTLLYNARRANVRTIARSFDGGLSWSKEETDSILPGVSRGCQASILRNGDILYFCGIDGIPETTDFDERARLAVYKSEDGGYTWPESAVIYPEAAGYACMDVLPDGRLAIIFEAGDTQGFTRKSIPDIKPFQRPEGWMRLDFMILDD